MAEYIKSAVYDNNGPNGHLFLDMGTAAVLNSGSNMFTMTGLGDHDGVY